MFRCKNLGLLLILSLTACMGATPGGKSADVTGGDPDPNGADHYVSDCIGDPDSASSCTVWTCDRVPAQYAYKTHCEGKRKDGSAPPMAPAATRAPDGSYSCPAGVTGGPLCPPARNGASSRCVHTELAIKCDSGLVCEGGHYASGNGCTPCSGNACSLEACSHSVACGGTGIPSTTCPTGEFYSEDRVRCVECTATTCGEPGCGATPICTSSCAEQGYYSDGTACRFCLPPFDCFRPACATSVQCNGNGNGNGGGNVVIGGGSTGHGNTGKNIPGCVKCVPGANRFCDGPNFCGWGQRTCQADGTWGPCIEEDDTPRPSGCKSKDVYSERCCEKSGACCEDLDGRHLLGDCANICKE